MNIYLRVLVKYRLDALVLRISSLDYHPIMLDVMCKKSLFFSNLDLGSNDGSARQVQEVMSGFFL